MCLSVQYILLSFQPVEICDALIKFLLGGIAVLCELLAIGVFLYRYITRPHGKEYST